MTKLKVLLSLLPKYEITGSEDVEVSGITDDSRKVKKDYLFIAVKGKTSDGHEFIDQAIKNGAKVVVGEKKLERIGATYVKVDDTREALGLLGSKLYDNPSGKLKVIGVTGTKGKTTTVHLIYHILSSLGKKAGMVSSVLAKIGEREIDTGFHVTSPDVLSLHKFLKEMVDEGCEYAVIEVSSHGIDQKRIAGVKFEVGVLTNIAPEHLDYHKTLKEYRRVKMSFINTCKFKVIEPKDTGIDILPGRFNNLDAECAVRAVEILGLDRAKALSTLFSFELPKGRLEEVKNNKGFRIFIDFAHTPDSLEAVLGYLKSQTKGKLISVFGCAGERDSRKRSKMGRISTRLADLSIFTAEDPRSEDIFDILHSMMRGANGKYLSIPERGEAIAYTLSVARRGDVVAILGKGHEKSMAYKGYEHPWDDHEAVKNYLEKNEKTSAIVLAAGKGTRMHSDLPKVLHEICGRPMIAYSLQNLRSSRIGEIVIVLSFKRNQIVKRIRGAVKIAVQRNPKGGTANATSSGLSLVSKEATNVTVLYGDDTAFYTAKTINNVLETHIKGKAILTFVTLMKDDPHSFGRILRDKKGNLVGIVEEKDATEEERKIKEINDSLYVFNKEWLIKNLPKIEKSPVTGEYYIPELIKMAIKQKEKVIAYKLPNSIEWQGINTPEELEKAKLKMAKRLESYEQEI